MLAAVWSTCPKPEEPEANVPTLTKRRRECQQSVCSILLDERILIRPHPRGDALITSEAAFR
jgi:hypothetical protein